MPLHLWSSRTALKDGKKVKEKFLIPLLRRNRQMLDAKGEKRKRLFSTFSCIKVLQNGEQQVFCSFSFSARKKSSILLP